MRDSYFSNIYWIFILYSKIVKGFFKKLKNNLNSRKKINIKHIKNKNQNLFIFELNLLSDRKLLVLYETLEISLWYLSFWKLIISHFVLKLGFLFQIFFFFFLFIFIESINYVLFYLFYLLVFTFISGFYFYLVSIKFGFLIKEIITYSLQFMDTVWCCN